MKQLLKLLGRRKNIIFLDKRQRFALQMVLLTAGLLITQLIWEDYRFAMVGILAFASYILTAWSLTENIVGIEWFMLFVLPVTYTASLSLFYYLLPGRWLTRLAVAVIFAVGIYAILLAENIYNVALNRSIQLLRAGRSVGLLFTLVVIFLSSNIIYSLRLPGVLSMVCLMAITFILTLQSLWSVNLTRKLTSDLFLFSVITAAIIGEIALAFSFWPIEGASYSLVLTAAYYSSVSLLQQHMLGRLFRDSVREYSIVFFFTFVLIVLTTRWA